MGNVSKKRKKISNSPPPNDVSINNGDEIEPLLGSLINSSDSKRESWTSKTDNSDDDKKLFKSNREMLILLALSLAIFSVTCCESILAPFYAPEVRLVCSTHCFTFQILRGGGGADVIIKRIRCLIILTSIINVTVEFVTLKNDKLVLFSVGTCRSYQNIQKSNLEISYGSILSGLKYI